jgi:hypothetical protein
VQELQHNKRRHKAVGTSAPPAIALTDDAVNIMVKRYNTPELQARVHTYLKSLKITSFRFDEKLDAYSTLMALTSEIKLSPMEPRQYQREIHAVEHLRNAVLGETWSNDVLRAMNPQTVSF